MGIYLELKNRAFVGLGDVQRFSREHRWQDLLINLAEG